MITTQPRMALVSMGGMLRYEAEVVGETRTCYRVRLPAKAAIPGDCPSRSFLRKKGDVTLRSSAPQGGAL